MGVHECVATPPTLRCDKSGAGRLLGRFWLRLEERGLKLKHDHPHPHGDSTACADLLQI